MPAPPFHCRACGFAGNAMVFSKVTTGGWVLFGLLLLMCFPFCWIPLISMKEHGAKCPRCKVLAT